RSRRNAGHNLRGKLSWWKISPELHTLCYAGALRNVLWRPELVADFQSCNRCARSAARIHQQQPKSPPQNRNRDWSAGTGMLYNREGFLQKKKIILRLQVFTEIIKAFQCMQAVRYMNLFR